MAIGTMLLPKPVSRARDRKEKRQAKELNWRRVRAWVLVRDSRRCRVCKTKEGVDVHHIRFRSVGGADTAENLAALCRICHEDVHGYRIAIEGDANKKLKVTRFA